MIITDTIRRNLFERPETITGAHLLFFKILELFIVAKTIQLAWFWGIYTLRIADVVVTLGIANHIDISFMHGNNLPVYNAIIITVLSVITYFRIGSKYQYLVIMVLFHLQYVARYTLGEIPHSANLIGMSVLAFALGQIFFEKYAPKYRFILGIIFFFGGLGYTTAAFSKMIGTGFDWVDGRHLWLWIGEKGTDILSRDGSWQPNFLQSMALSSIPIATTILIFGLLTEFFGFLMWFTKTRPFIVTFIIGMHIGITLSMNIRFDAFVIELILIGYPWAAWYNKLRPGFTSLALKRFI